MKGMLSSSSSYFDASRRQVIAVKSSFCLLPKSAEEKGNYVLWKSRSRYVTARWIVSELCFSLSPNSKIQSIITLRCFIAAPCN